ncbi:MAG: chloride channel protein [Euzebya sp.]
MKSRAAVRGRMAAFARREPGLLALGGIIGILTGLLAYGLVKVIALTQAVAFGDQASSLRTVLVPTVGALIVGTLVTYWVPEVSGGGIVEVMRTIALRGGRFRKRVPAGMLIASGLALGTGGSGGREAPIVLGGGAIGGLMGTLFRVDEDRMRTLVAAGAAAGIGASFNAPIGGMLFAIELILGRLSARSLQVVVLASVAASVTARELVGPEIVFESRREYGLSDPRELIGYAVIGILAALVGIAFLHGERIGHTLFQRLPLARPLRIGLGGLGVGVIALAVPEVLGSGHLLPPIFGNTEPIKSMIEGNAGGSGLEAVRFLLILLIAKFGATMLSVTSGNAVGSLLPTLFTGAALGGAVGHAVDLVLPGAAIEPGAFALVGMAAVFAAAARAPLTSILIVFELTGDYGLVLPLMFAAGLATFVADRMAPEGIYTDPLRRQGVVFDEPEEIDVMQSVVVEEVMTTDPPTVPFDLAVRDLQFRFAQSGHHGYAVTDESGGLFGVVTLSDMPDDDIPAEMTVADICARKPLTVAPTTPVFRALHRMATADIGRLPVVDVDASPTLVGMLRRNDIIDAYRTAVNRGVGLQHRRDRSTIRDLAGVHFLELTVTPGSVVDGTALRDLSLPEGTTLTSVRRDGRLIVPRGDTVLLAGDEIVALSDPDHTDPLLAMFLHET